jgi:hypothetical protein
VLLLKQQYKPFHADRKAYCRHIRSAQIAHQAVISASPADCVLGAEPVGNHLEGRTHIIIEAANDARVYNITGPEFFKMSFHGIEMSTAIFAYVVDKHWSAFEQGPALFDFAVENAERVGLFSTQTVRAEPVSLFCKKILENIPVNIPAVGTAQRIDVENDPGNADPVHKQAQHVHHLGIDHRAVNAEDLGVDLMKLPVASLLGTLVPEHRSDLIEFQRRRIGMERMLYIRPHDRSRRLRAQGQPLAVPVLEGVHLFFNDIGALSDAAREKLQLLRHGRPYFAVTEVLEDLPRRVFNLLPPAGLVRQYIVHPSNGLNIFHFFPRQESKLQHNQTLLEKAQIKVKGNPEIREIYGTK